MKNDKNFSAKCYAAAAVLFCICAVINFFSDNAAMGAMYLCLGCTFSCLTANERNKNKADSENSGDDEKPAEEDKKDEENK